MTWSVACKDEPLGIGYEKISAVLESLLLYSQIIGEKLFIISDSVRIPGPCGETGRNHLHGCIVSLGVGTGTTCISSRIPSTVCVHPPENENPLMYERLLRVVSRQLLLL